jgi:phosphatidylethanolamine-binding protein (PEBP) family uncharacterized protein
MRASSVAFGALIFLAGCSAGPSASPAATGQTITVTSDAITDGQAIPVKYTADGQNISPPLAWKNVPAKAAALVLIVDDPDAPSAQPFCHWVVVNLPPT